MLNIKKHQTHLLGILLFSLIYISINYTGWYIDNDSIAYIGFAKQFSQYTYPTSPLYQPGIGFFINLIHAITNFDYLTSFQVVNFASGLVLVFIMCEILMVEQYFDSEKQNKALVFIAAASIATMPTIHYICSLLYADALFILITFSTLYAYVRFSSSLKLAHILILTMLIALAVTIKYNAIVLLVTISSLIILNNGLVLKRKVLFLATIAVLPIVYVIVWKLYNGNLGAIEFNNYSFTNKLDKYDGYVIEYIKINILNILNFYIQKLSLGHTIDINFKVQLIIFSTISSITLYLYVIRGISKSSLMNRTMLLHSIVYIVIFIAIFSINRMVEVEIRTMATLSLILSLLLIANFNRLRNYKFIAAILLLLFNTLSLFKTYERYIKENIIHRADRSMGHIKFVLDLNLPENLLKSSSATPQFNRYIFALGSSNESMQILPRKEYWFVDKQVKYSDTEYLKIVEEVIQHTSPASIIVIEKKSLSDGFIYTLTNSFHTNILYNDKNAVIFKGSKKTNT